MSPHMNPFNKHGVVAPSHAVPCSTEGCKEEALTWSLCTCTHLYKKDRHISLVEEDSWKSMSKILLGQNKIAKIKKEQRHLFKLDF